jgi:hypothetical protein
MKAQPHRSIKPAPANSLANELAQEKASALGRIGRTLETALSELRDFDAHSPAAQPAAQRIELRAALVQRANTALWHFVVQREACGLRDMRYVLRAYRVPAEVAVQLGAQAPRRHRNGG